MTQEKVTREELRKMHIGQTRIFTLNHPKKLQSACVTCNQLKKEDGIEFRVSKDYDAVAVSITRIN